MLAALTPACGSGGGASVGKGDEVGVWCRPGYVAPTQYLRIRDGTFALWDGSDDDAVGGNSWFTEPATGTEWDISCQDGCDSNLLTRSIGAVERHHVIAWVPKEYFVVFDEIYNQYEYWSYLADYTADDAAHFAANPFDPSAYPECQPVVFDGDGLRSGTPLARSEHQEWTETTVEQNNAIVMQLSDGQVVAGTTISDVGGADEDKMWSQYQFRMKRSTDGLAWGYPIMALSNNGTNPEAWLSTTHLKPIPGSGFVVWPSGANPNTQRPLFFDEATFEWTTLAGMTTCGEGGGGGPGQRMDVLYNKATGRYFLFCVADGVTHFRMPGSNGTPTIVFSDIGWSSSVQAVLDPAAGPTGTVYMLLDPLPISGDLRLYSRPDEALSGGGNGNTDFALTTIDPACGDGCHVTKLVGYQVSLGTHHILAEVSIPGLPVTGLLHLHGTPEQGFESSLVAPGLSEGTYTSYGTYVNFQVPLSTSVGAQKLYVAFDDGECIRVLASETNPVAWAPLGDIPTRTRPQPGSVFVWGDGKIGFVSGNTLTDYNHAELIAGLKSCKLSAEPWAKPSEPETAGNLVQIDMVHEGQIQVHVEPTAPSGDPICSVEARTFAWFLKFHSETAKALACGDPIDDEIPFPEGSGSSVMQFVFSDKAGLLPVDRFTVEVELAPLIEKVEAVVEDNPWDCTTGDLPITWTPVGASSVRVQLKQPDSHLPDEVYLEVETADDGSHVISATDLAALDAADAFVNLQFLFLFDLPFPVADGSWLRFKAERKGDGVQLKPVE